jgi:4a-hydroxytetrahydrobiopterin dehydratase
MGTSLPEADVRSALRNLPGWTVNGKAIERQFQFHDFVQTMKFVNRVAEAAEQAGHHPDIAISYNKVTFSLVSHDSGGVTQRDLKMAKRINEIAG